MPESSTATATVSAETIPMRQQLPVHAAGIFSNGAVQLAAVIVPLWMLKIDPPPS